MKKLLALSLIGSAFLSNAYSQSNNWEGGYLQYGIGYQNQSLADSGGTSNGVLSSNGTSYTAGFSNQGSFTSQIGLGYNFSLNSKWLAGIGVDASPFKGSAMNLNVTDGINNPTYSIANKNSYDYFLSLNYALDKNNLAYAKVGGVTTNFNNGVGNVTGSLAGVGIKHILGNGLYSFGELNYIKYQNFSDTDTGTISGNSENFLIGLGYRFN